VTTFCAIIRSEVLAAARPWENSFNRSCGHQHRCIGKEQARDKTPDAGETKHACIRRFRQQHSLPVLNALKSGLTVHASMHLSAKSIDNIAPKVVPDTRFGDAVSYALNQWDYLTRYITDGSMPTLAPCRPFNVSKAVAT
jgi:hypothetical protein